MNETRKVWSKLDVKLLIKLYELRPELWDVASNQFKNKDLRQNTLRAFASMFETTPSEIVKKINNLRSQYYSQLRKAQSKNLGDRNDHTWPYFEALRFLPRNERQTTGKSGNLVNVGAANNGPDCSFLKAETVKPDLYIEEKKVQMEEKETRKGKKRPIDDVMINPITSGTLRHEDDHYIFGSYVASELRNTESEYLQKKMKRRIKQIILEINEEEEIF